MADLHMLMTDTPQGRCPYAESPVLDDVRRDSLITALQMLWFEPSVARGVLRRLAHFQAKHDDPFADAQPGKILHEMRCGEMATLREVPFGLYYGSVDATPLFVLLVVSISNEPATKTLSGSCGPQSKPHCAGLMVRAIRIRTASSNTCARPKRALQIRVEDSCDAIFHADGCRRRTHRPC